MTESKKLWAVHIPVQDDTYAAPSHEAALDLQQRHNGDMIEYFAKNPNMSHYKNGSMMEVIEWDGDAQSHAKDIEDNHELLESP